MSAIARYRDYDNLPHFCVRRSKQTNDAGTILARPRTRQNHRTDYAGKTDQIAVVTSIDFNGYMSVGTDTNIPNQRIGYADVEEEIFENTAESWTARTLTDTAAFTGLTLAGSVVCISVDGAPNYWGSILSNTNDVLTLHGVGFRPTGIPLSGTGVYSIYNVNAGTFVPIITPIYGNRSATANTIETRDCNWDDLWIPLPADKHLVTIPLISGQFLDFSDSDIMVEGFWMPASAMSTNLVRFQPS